MPDSIEPRGLSLIPAEVSSLKPAGILFGFLATDESDAEFEPADGAVGCLGSEPPVESSALNSASIAPAAGRKRKAALMDLKSDMCPFSEKRFRSAMQRWAKRGCTPIFSSQDFQCPCEMRGLAKRRASPSSQASSTVRRTAFLNARAHASACFTAPSISTLPESRSPPLSGSPRCTVLAADGSRAVASAAFGWSGGGCGVEAEWLVVSSSDMDNLLPWRGNAQAAHESNLAVAVGQPLPYDVCAPTHAPGRDPARMRKFSPFPHAPQGWQADIEKASDPAPR